MRETWSKTFRSVGAARPLMPSITLPIVIPTASRKVPFSAALGTPRLSSATQGHSLRQRLSVNNFRSDASAENLANVKIVDVDFPPPARGTIQRDRKGLASDKLCVWIEPTLVTPTAGDDVAMQMLNHTHCRQPAHRNDGQCQPDWARAIRDNGLRCVSATTQLIVARQYSRPSGRDGDPNRLGHSDVFSVVRSF